MRKHVLYISIWISSLLFTSQLFAEETVSSTNSWPESISVVEQQQDFKVVGRAIFSVLFWDIYNSELQTLSGQYPPLNDADDIVYKIHYLTDASSVELLDYTQQQWQHLGLSEKQYATYLATLSGIWPDINAGDKLALVSNKTQSAFYYNGRLVGTIKDKLFAPLFLDIWLSKHTSEPKLRAQLLGRVDND